MATTPKASLRQIPSRSGYVRVPGTSAEVAYTFDAAGRLRRLTCAGRTYLHETGGQIIYEDGWVRTREVAMDRLILRRVEALKEHWLEAYRWDEGGNLVLVDGVAIERDGRGRIIACRGTDVVWEYVYDAEGLCGIHGPFGEREIELDGQGRPVRAREHGHTCSLSYDAAGRRVGGPSTPSSWNRDSLGRLWTVAGRDGRIVTTYLWDGFACLGRIDGPPGEPLAAVFSLDPSLTPVRVITRAGCVRIPRDAYGEALLDYAGVPGLFGGAHHEGRVHFAFRRLDPRVGAFDEPDPLHGGPDDVRRSRGFRGPLPVDPPEHGAYTVCRHDPVGRADPTGAISWLAGTFSTLSSLTWSSQHILASTLAVELLNFLLALFRGELGRWVDKEAVSSKWLGEWGFRFDPVGLETLNINVGRAWTYYRYVWARSEEFDDLSHFRVFAPDTPFRPTLYGTLLHAVPADDGDNQFTPFVLRGSGWSGASIPARATGWSRAGGPAEPVIPGSRTPHFPSGGLHFDVLNDRHGPKAGEVIEVEPAGVLAAGRIEDREVLVVGRTGLSVAAGTELFITDTSRSLRKVEVDTAVSVSGQTRIRMTENPVGLARTNLTVRGVGAVQSTETLPAGTANDRLNVADGVSTNRYFPQDPLLLSQAGVVVGAVLVDRLEARLEVGIALDAPTGRRPLQVELLEPVPGSGGTVTVVSTEQLSFGSGAAPDVGEALLINGTAIVLVTEKPSDEERRIAPALDASTTGDVPWLVMRRARTLGVWDGQSGATQLTYTPEESGQAPSTGHMGIRDDENKLRQVRTVSSRVYDELIVAAGPLPGNTAASYDVERRVFADPNESGVRMETVTALVLDENPAPEWNPAGGARHPVLQLNPLQGSVLSAAVGSSVPVISGALSGTTLTATTGGSSAPTPGQMVALRDPSGAVSDLAAVLVRAVRLTAMADRDITIGVGDLEITPLDVGSASYRAEALAADRVRLRPVAYEVNASGAVQTDSSGNPITRAMYMPRFEAGELVEVLWTDSSAAVVRHAYRVAGRQGTSLSLEAGPPGLDLTTAGVDLRVRLLIPANPRTGSSRLGREGGLASGNPRELVIKVWSPDALSTIQAQSRPVAVVRGRHGEAGAGAMPVIITAVSAVAVEFYGVPSAFSSVTSAEVLVPALAPTGPAYVSEYTLEGKDVLFAEGNPLAGHTDPVYAILYSPASGDDRRAHGTFSGGHVMIPEDDSESWQLSRYESLETHELYHTRHISILGPLLLSPLPKVIWELPVFLSDAGIDEPPFSAYISATVHQQGGNLVLEIPDMQGVSFDRDSQVEIAQQTGRTSAKLGTREGNRFVLPASPQLRPGDAFVRLDQRNDGVSNFFRHLSAWSDFDTVGGLMSTVVGPILMLIPWVIALAVSGFREGRGFRWWLTFHPARVPDPAQPAAIQVDAVDGDPFEVEIHDIVEIRVGETSADNAVTAIRPDGIIELRDIPNHEGAERTLKIARVASDDPLNFASTHVLTRMGFGWMRWIFDPYGQLQFRTDAEAKSFWDVFRRSLRWGFGSTSWTLFPFGFFLFDNAMKQGAGGHQSIMEQSASEQSGDLYSPLGRFRGTPEYVGDIGRYWYWPASRTENLIDVSGSLQDAPGVHTVETLRVIPSLDTSGTGTGEPNLGAGISSGISDAALDLPDLFYEKDRLQPYNPTGSSPDGFEIAERGLIPFGSSLQRTLGMYVAFARPNAYRATVRNGIGSAAEGRVMTEEGDTTLGVFSVKQPLYFDRTGDQAVKDVTVRMAGGTVNNGDTVEAILCQRLRLAVEPDGARRYSVTVLQPDDGPVVRQRGDVELQVQTMTGEEPIEISRDHIVAPFGIQEDKARAWPQVHLHDTLHVPVRTFSVRVVDTVPVRSTADPAASPISGPVHPGAEVFLLIPAQMQGPPRQSQAYTVATTPAPSRHPQADLDADADATTAHADYLAGGGVLRLAFAPDDPPEEPVDLTWEVDVRATQVNATGITETISAVVRASLRLEPHFRLNLPSGSGPFQVARGNTFTLVCDGSQTPAPDGVVVTPSDGITVTVAGANVNLAVAADASPGIRRAAVRSQSGDGLWAARSFEIT